ncbi:MAG TPA: sensor domain-containing diguanylate cyclase [Chroococcidiopsis sp.]
MCAIPIWNDIYPWIKAAVTELESLDGLLSQAVRRIATVYHAECVLFVGLEGGPGTLRAYATSGEWAALEPLSPLMLLYTAERSPDSVPIHGTTEGVGQFSPKSLPDWLLDQLKTPGTTQLPTGELIVSIENQERLSTLLPGASTASNSLQLVLRLRRPAAAADPAGPPVATDRSPSAPSESPSSNVREAIWTAQEVEGLEVVGSQLGLAYSALFWRHRLEQSRQQAALVGRISRLINSSLNPDEIVGRIVAELGQGLQCDRCILVDLRHTLAKILAVWDHPDRDIPRLEGRQIERALWQDVVDMFFQGGASYLQVEGQDVDPDPLQQWLAQVKAASVLIVPLFIQAEFFGAVALLSHHHGRVYQLDELQTMRQVADQAAIALTNAQNFQSLWYRQESLRLQNSTLQQEVIRDELTQLMNRRSLERELEQLSTVAVWAVQSPFSIIVCDIDYFKLVNDTHGHLVGDEVLQTLAHRLQHQLRKDTPVYRYGGEEFIVILVGTLLKTATDVAERLRYAIGSEPIETSVGRIKVTASFGVTEQSPERDRHAWDVVHRADQALYEAKRQGRDRVKTL